MSTKTHFDAAFSLKKPCGNCPFLKEGAVELEPGRLQSIVQSLLDDDGANFHCHKTVYNEKTGGAWVEGEDGASSYQCSHKEAFCAGAMIFMQKVGHSSVLMRMAQALGYCDRNALMESADLVIDPEMLERSISRN